MRQHSSTQAELPRVAPEEGFSGGRDAETILLSESVVVRRSQPLHFSIQPGVADPEGERRRRFERGAEYLAGPLFVSRLPGALVDTSRFIICPSEDRYLLDSFRHPRGLARWGYSHVEGEVWERADERIAERPERVVVLGAQANRIYSHWLLESVLRALLLAPFDDGRVVYLTPPLEPWQQQALALAGVPPERTLTLPRRQLVRFAEVFAVSRGFAQIPALIPDAVQTLRGLLRATVASANRREPADPAEPAGSATTGRRLWVSRRHMERRHISNESQLVEVLAGHGFEVVYPERLGLAEQMAMFARAEAVAGPFGSGLTNLIFSPRGTLVLELQPEDLDFGGNTFLWNLASIREQPFAQVVCPVSEGMRDLPLGERDMTVDVRAINELLGRLLHATQRATAPSTPPQRAWP